MKPQLALLLLVAAGASACSPAPVAPVTTATAAAPKAVASFQEIMLTQVDAAADEIWQSVAFVNDERGAREHRPQTDEEWLKLRRAAVLLTELPHLMNADRPMKSVRTDLPEIDTRVDLEAVKARIDADKPGFNAMAKTVQDLSVQLVAAIDRKDAAALLNLGGPLDQACEACHEVYYYPPAAAAAAQAPAK